MLGLTLLLTTATTALDQLCLSRMQRDLGILTPEYLDPSLSLTLEGPACDVESAARQRLGHIACQLQAAGPVTSTQAILEHGQAGRRQTALLALAGAGAWQSSTRLPGGGELHRRMGADGRVFLLAGSPDAPAPHAPHAIRGFTEQLWCLPAHHPAADGTCLPAEAPLLSSDGAPDSLSLTAALLDLLFGLQAAGAHELAAQVSMLGHDTVLPKIPARHMQPASTPVAA
jgi:hypothetical protein